MTTATFTLPLREVIEFTGGTADIDPTTGVRKLVGGNIGLQYLTTNDPSYKDTLIGKIVDHYWNREIGFETVDLFQHKMRIKANEIMPVYNALYKTQQIEFDPLATVNLKTVMSGTAEQNVSANSESETISDNVGKSRTVQQDFPQSSLSGDADYASAAADANSDAHVQGSGTEANTSDSTSTNENESLTTGYQGVASELLMRYRQSIINIDLMIIDEFADCFMQVWDNGDTYSEGGYYL